MSLPSSSHVVFPSFAVVDGSWGPCYLNISDVYGLIIESKETGQILENWFWRDTSHITIKKASSRLVVQAKKLNGIKKILAFKKLADLERFERVLKNAVPILTLFNIKRQRKFVVIQPLSSASGSIRTESGPLILDVNQNPQVKASIPPPPPPPPMVQQAKMALIIKAQGSLKPKIQVIEPKSDVLKEMAQGFANGILMPSEIKRARIESEATLMISQPVANSEEIGHSKNPIVPIHDVEKISKDSLSN